MVNFTDQNIVRIFGIEDAERENPERLKEFFLKNKSYDNLKATLPMRILVGHKGSGKSALLRIAYLEDLDDKRLALWLKPNDLKRFDIQSDISFTGLMNIWMEEIAEAIYSKSIEFLAGITRDKLDSAWQKVTITTLLKNIDLFVRNSKKQILDEVRSQIADNFLQDQIIVVYIDDLDQGWDAKPSDIQKISALFSALRDLTGDNPNIYFRISVRSDVYHLVRTSDESTDKIESSLVWISWTNDDILALMAKRVESFFGRQISDQRLLTMSQSESAKYLHQIIDARFSHVGKWENAPIERVLCSIIRRRPRDLIKLFHGAARNAYKRGNDRITTSDLRDHFETYSNNRLQDTVNEFRSELPDIGKLLNGMRPTTKERRTSDMYTYTRDSITKKIQNLMQQTRFVFASGGLTTPDRLIEFMYKIDFLQAIKEREDGVVIRKYFDENQNVAGQWGDYGFSWEVHLAFRWVLQPTLRTDDIFKQYEIVKAVEEY